MFRTVKSIFHTENVVNLSFDYFPLDAVSDLILKNVWWSVPSSGCVVSRQVGYLNAKNDIERFLRKLKWLKSDKRLRRGF